MSMLETFITLKKHYDFFVILSSHLVLNYLEYKQAMPIYFNAVFDIIRWLNSIVFAYSPICFLVITGWGH